MFNIAIEWKHVESMGEEPEAVDMTTAPGKVYMRKNIVLVPAADAKPEHYEYDEVLLTKDAYNEYTANIEIVKAALAAIMAPNM